MEEVVFGDGGRARPATTSARVCELAENLPRGLLDVLVFVIEFENLEFLGRGRRR